MTLETQYKQYIEEHPDCTYTFEEWMEKVMRPFAIDAVLQIEKLENGPSLEEICKVANIHLSRVKGCYLFGSRVYGTFSDESDWDVILIANTPDTAVEFNNGKINVHVIYPDLFRKYAHDNQVKAIECLFSPKWAQIVPFDCEFVYKEKSVRHNFSHTVSNSWVKCMKKLAQGDYYSGTKSIFHALRILDFGIQFARDRKIQFSSSNDLWKEIVSREWTWEELKEKYQPLRNARFTEFRKLTTK